MKPEVYDECFYIIFFNDFDIINHKSKTKKFLSNFFKKIDNTKTHMIKTNILYFIDFQTNVYSDNLTKNYDYEFFVNKFFFNYFKKKKSFRILNLKTILSKYGLNKCLDIRNYYLTRCRLSYDGLSYLGNTIENIIKQNSVINKKLLILDCDNTLWGGVVGEDGYQKIVIGQDGIGKAFQDFQIKIKELKKTGLLLAIASKNDPGTVDEVFKKNKNMILKSTDFVLKKINWSDKTTNIKNIVEELNIGLDSVIFWDDNPVERSKVKKNLKEIEVIDPPKDVTEWPNYLSLNDIFLRKNITKEDIKKSEQYKIRAKFINEKNLKKNEKDYLKSIKLKPKIHEISQSNISRAIQLTEKTNQFNIRKRIYSEIQIKEFVKNLNDLTFLISLKDEYGDHGIIGLVCCNRIDKVSVFLNTFLLSCRILGRYLENWILYQIKKKCEKLQIKYLLIEYEKNDKNSFLDDTFIKDNFKMFNEKLINNLSVKKFIKENKIKSKYYVNIKKMIIQNIDVYKK